jgi:phenylalanyl-tRNA synthetase beta chain
MKVSYNWLKDYIDFDLEVAELEEILTSTGLEVSSIEEFNSIQGGLEGVFIGEVLTCEKHPNADKLSVCSVDIGGDEILPIVCGASNVAKGQKVAVATVGTTIYPVDSEEGLTLKKVKIRGELSKGMICAEDELGLGRSHDGIMVLDSKAVPGTPAAEYFQIEKDYIIEIDLTPNRSDAVSHIGVARDIAAYLALHKNSEQEIQYPSVDAFKTDNNNLPIEIEIQDKEACPRYSGVCMDKVKIGPSPEWLQNRLNAAGIRPLNNVVDITNYVLMETGHPLHAFDYDKIEEQKLVIRKLPEGTRFTTLDEEERKLSAEDLMICDANKGMCIAGVFGGNFSGVSENTSRIFIESAYFNPVSVRKTAKRHQLKTDASFRFERGADPEITVYALKRCALLIKEICGAEISSEIVDIYPEEIRREEIRLRFSRLNMIAGKEIKKEDVIKILETLEYVILKRSDLDLIIEAPKYRVDVNREVDIIEEVLRIYSLNNIGIPDSINVSFPVHIKPDMHKVKNNISDFMSARGFYEAWSNSISNAKYVEYIDSIKTDETVNLLNPLSSELNAMRQEMVFGLLEALQYNRNRQNPDIKLYEFGKVYKLNADISTRETVTKRFDESVSLALIMSGMTTKESWRGEREETNFYDIKEILFSTLKKLGIEHNQLSYNDSLSKIFIEGSSYSLNGNWFAHCGRIHPSIRKQFDIESDAFFAEINWRTVEKRIAKSKTVFEPLPKFPEVRRDLALVLDKETNYEMLEKIAFKTEKKLLRSVNLFDVFEDKKLGEGKKSYAISFALRDDEKTLNDKQIDKIMDKMVMAFNQELNAELR